MLNIKYNAVYILKMQNNFEYCTLYSNHTVQESMSWMSKHLRKHFSYFNFFTMASFFHSDLALPL